MSRDTLPEDPETLLELAASAQTELWRICAKLEEVLELDTIDTSRDLSEQSVESLKKNFS